VGKARRITAAIRETYEYDWVGVYDQAGNEIGLVAWSGSGPPIDPRSNLPSGRSEMMTVVLHPAGGIAGFLGAANDLSNALGPEDQRRLEDCLRSLAPFWGGPAPP
jgi:hypothetical protein